MTLLNTLWTRLNYQSSHGREQERLFSLVQALVKAQFQLADAELTRRTWQEVADQHFSVERVEHLLYCCCFQEDAEALKEADDEYLRGVRAMPSLDTHGIGVFEHC